MSHEGEIYFWLNNFPSRPIRLSMKPCDNKQFCAAGRSISQRSWCLLAVLFSMPAWPQSDRDLGRLSIEDLMNIQVTSVSKKEQKISQAAAAIFVITPADITRSGATTIPDLLRMVPGLEVAQINSNTWAITARGFNHELADKLLVMIDGRSVYTMTFGGVNWETQDVPLEDIARIEVIRGPGGTMWGANAVNGVINIITKKAGETSGALISAGGGNQALAFGTAQYGGKAGANFDYRVFAKYQDFGQTPSIDQGDLLGDGWHLLHGGFRLDGKLSQEDSLTVQGDIYRGREGAEITHTSLDPPENTDVVRTAILSGGNVLGRWDHIFANGSESSLQLYFDNNKRDGPQALEDRNTIDFDFHHRMHIGPRNELVWGVGYRRSSDHTVGTIDQAYIPADLAVQIFNGFVQDEITLRPDRLILTVGAKLEHDTFAGFDADPSLRIAWVLNSRNTIWAASSRASRTPSRVDTGAFIALAAFPGDNGVAQEVVLLGNPQQKAEHVISNELGYRTQATRNLSIDVAAFFNVYNNLRTREPGTPFLQSPELWVIPITWGNKMHGTTEGIEISSEWKINNHWRLSPGLTFLQMHLDPDATSLDTSSAPEIEGSNPHYQAQLRSTLDLRRNLSWDVNLYYVDRLTAQGIPSYERLDSQLRWRVNERLQLDLVGQNLLHDLHSESNDIFTIVNGSQVKRSLFGRITWRF
jgi:iron complex outermembrane receptor protein